MFPLTERKVGGYTFGAPTFYSAHHLGVDYVANYIELYAPFNGVIQEAFWGTEGGKTIWFKPDGQDVIIRFLHLSDFKVTKGQRVNEGQVIAITGNTGTLTKGPHLHVDISRGGFVLAWPGHFIDPETFVWDTTAAYSNVDQPVSAPAGNTTAVELPITFWVELQYRANFREEPNTGSKIMFTYDKGTRVECNATAQGELVTVGGVSSDKWYKSSKHGYYVSATVATHL